MIAKPYLFLAGKAVLGVTASVGWRVGVGLAGVVVLVVFVAFAAEVFGAGVVGFAAGILDAWGNLVVGAGVSFIVDAGMF